MTDIVRALEHQAEQWQRRRNAVGRAQARYLYVLVLIGAFYLALSVRIIGGEAKPGEALTLPILGLGISAFIVWATAPIILGFALLATLGTFFALTRAEDGMGFTGTVGEQHDVTPTALDFVVYATTGSSRLLAALALLVYPLAVALFYVEAAWIWFGVRSSRLPIPAREPLVIIGGFFLAAALPGLAYLWVRKALKMGRGIRDLWQHRHDQPAKP